MEHRLRSRDTAPNFSRTLADADGEAFDLTGFTVTMNARRDDGVEFSRAMVVEDAAAGEVSYDWVSADWDQDDALPPCEPGYEVEIRLEYEAVSAGERITFPQGEDDSFDTLVIYGDIAQG